MPSKIVVHSGLLLLLGVEDRSDGAKKLLVSVVQASATVASLRVSVVSVIIIRSAMAHVRDREVGIRLLVAQCWQTDRGRLLLIDVVVLNWDVSLYERVGMAVGSLKVVGGGHGG